MSAPDMKLACVSNLWLRQMHFLKAGDQNEGHLHNFDHLTLLAKGKLKVTVDGVPSEFTAPQMIYISTRIKSTNWKPWWTRPLRTAFTLCVTRTRTRSSIRP